ncbi:MAG: hypothetical protein V2J51_01365 [Erythrobacter sp.]|jgi:hypothetical protein|nr:hypothetical protein [Erythrobacter sp.]
MGEPCIPLSANAGKLPLAHPVLRAYIAGMLENSRFNPSPGVKDFWSEFRKPQPFRWLILALSSLPLAVMLYWLSGETVYKTPDRPQITYITTFDPDRTEAEIIASNEANQEVKELRAAKRAEVEQKKRDLYKALGAVAGMDVEEIDERGRETRAAEAEARKAELDRLMRRDAEADAASEATDRESTAP